jgi:hypothetical protein
MADLEFHSCALRLRDQDTVAVMKRPVRTGDRLVNGTLDLTVRRDIPAGHKIALQETEDGRAMIKYGQVIGFARGRILAGDHVHSDNLEARV